MTLVHVVVDYGDDDINSNFMLKIIDRIKIRYGKQPAHICSPDCLRLFPDDNQSDFWLSKNPYLKPMVKNFARIAVKNPTKRSIEICYISPCGKPLTTIENIQKYLLLTKCMDLTTINFTLSKNFVLQKISIQEKAPTIMDISNGLEPIPISAVNSITNKPFNSSRRYIKNSVYESKTYLNVKHIVDNINQCNVDDCSTLCHSRCKCAGGVCVFIQKKIFFCFVIKVSHDLFFFLFHSKYRIQVIVINVYFIIHRNQFSSVHQNVAAQYIV